MAADFLGRGWQHPITRLGNTGAIVPASGNESIEEAIWIILATAPGERVRRPDFGCGIHAMVFELNTAGTIGRVQDFVTKALVRWEPRIDLLNVEVSEQESGSQLMIDIQYRVRATNNFFNLVFPFYLTRGSVYD